MGAVSMFGGVDIFGRSEKKESVKSEPSESESLGTTPTQPKATKTAQKGGGGGLFTDLGGDDEDIFNFQPTIRKNK